MGWTGFASGDHRPLRRARDSRRVAGSSAMSSLAAAAPRLLEEPGLLRRRARDRAAQAPSRLNRSGNRVVPAPLGSSKISRSTRRRLGLRLQDLFDLLLVLGVDEFRVGMVESRTGGSRAIASWKSGTGAPPTTCTATMVAVQLRRILAGERRTCRPAGSRGSRRPSAIARTWSRYSAPGPLLPDAAVLLAEGGRARLRAQRSSGGTGGSIPSTMGSSSPSRSFVPR